MDRLSGHQAPRVLRCDTLEASSCCGIRRGGHIDRRSGGTPADTPQLARSMIASGLRATLTCVDPKKLTPQFAGREFDHALLADLSSPVSCSMANQLR
jgi:hypothetical protein